MANDYDKTNPYFSTDFAAYDENLKWQSENNFNNQQAWDARLYASWEREQVQDWNEYMWNQNNEYNSIGSQIQRARDAGVNPAAIISGDYKSPTATAPQSSPTGPVQSHAGTGDAQRMQAITSSADSLVGAAHGYVENRLSAEQIALNSKQIDSQVHLNYEHMRKLAADSGVADATEKQIRKAVSWIDTLNYAGVMDKLSQINERINNIIVAYAELGIDWRQLEINENVAESEIAVNTATEESIRVGTAGQRIENAWKNDKLYDESEMRKLQIWELGQRKDIANIMQVPLGTSEWEFNYLQMRKGNFVDYIKYAVIPMARAKMKPSDLNVRREHTLKNEAQIGPIKVGLDNVTSDYVGYDYFPFGGLRAVGSPRIINP